ncbi:MAG: diguanylate cyclase [Rubrivivax sp.]|nr:MAG: diguanylate cyclase [Rubrivivax sp.]
MALSASYPQYTPAIDPTLRRTVEVAPLPLVLTDLNLTPLVFSVGWHRSGLSYEEPAAFKKLLGDSFVLQVAQATNVDEVMTATREIVECGQRRTYFIDSSSWPGQEEPAKFLLVALRDVSETVNAKLEVSLAQAGLAEQISRLNAALGNVPHGICMFDREHELIVANEAYVRLYGLPPGLLRPGTPLTAVLDYRIATGSSPIDLSKYFAAEDRAKKDGRTASHDVPLVDGRTIRVTHTPIDGGGYVTTHEDISERIRASAQIEFLAYRDTLTEVANRASFQQDFEQALESAQRQEGKVGLVIVDVDHFKVVNDTYGHDAGDALLKALARRLVGAFRRADTVARLGGDEFAVVARDLKDQRDLRRPLDNFQAALQEPIEHAGHILRISASIGAALFDGQGSGQKLFKDADVALYQAKSQGRNRCVIHQGQDADHFGPVP